MMKMSEKVWRAAGSTRCPCTGPTFDFQHPQYGLLPAITPVSLPHNA